MSPASPPSNADVAAPTWREQHSEQRRQSGRAAMRLARGAATASAVLVTSIGAGFAASVAIEVPDHRQAIVVSAATCGATAALCALVGAAHVRRRLNPLRLLLKWMRRQRAGAIERLPAHWLAPGMAHGEVAEMLCAVDEMNAGTVRDRAALAAQAERNEVAIRDLETKLEHRAKQLTTANERLVGEIAEKEDFVRAVSHDLNAPLRNIAGMVAMLLAKNAESLPADVLHRLQRIKANVDVEAGLIDELLEFSRIKTRRQALHLVEVEKLVWELRGMFENDLKTRGIELVLETSLPNLFAERVRVRQIFQNLIDNAIKYMGDGHASDGRQVREIRVGCRVSITEAEFYVRDTGVGIEPDDLDKVFYIFRRGRNEATQKVSGKGVGLASVKSIVETYAGRIWVESQLGVGTTFRFTINGQYVPAVSGKVPSEMSGQATHAAPSLAA